MGMLPGKQSSIRYAYSNYLHFLSVTVLPINWLFAIGIDPHIGLDTWKAASILHWHVTNIQRLMAKS